MTDRADGDDLWANTRPGGEPPADPGPGPRLPDPDATPPAGIPPVAPSPGAVPPPPPVPPGDPTMIQPAVGGGFAAGPPPPAPPGGGGPPFDDEPGDTPPWLLPAAAALIVLLLIALVILLVRDGGDDPDTAPTTLPATETTLEPILTTTSGPDTTVPPGTTDPSTTTAPTTTTGASTTTAAPTTTTVAPTTTAAPTTTTPTTTTTTTTVAPNPLPDPGFARIDDEVVPLEATCSVAANAPSTVTGFLVTTTAGRVQVDRRTGGGASSADLLFIETGATATSTSVVPSGAGFVATMSGAGGPFEIAVNPPAGGVDACDFLVRSSETTLDDAFTQGVLDFCTARAGDELVFVAILTEQGRTLIVDLEDGRADISFLRRAGEDRFGGLGTSVGGVYDGLLEDPSGVTLLFNAGLNVPGPRTCTPDELF